MLYSTDYLSIYLSIYIYIYTYIADQTMDYIYCSLWLSMYVGDTIKVPKGLLQGLLFADSCACQGCSRLLGY